MTLKEINENGIREIHQRKGCNCCYVCAHLEYHGSPIGYKCSKMKKSHFHDPRFPYDNTKCKEFRQA